MKKNLFFFAAMAAAVWFTGCNKEEDEPSPEDYFQVHFDANGATDCIAPQDTTMASGKSYKIRIDTERSCLGVAHKNADGSFEMLSCTIKSLSCEFKYQPKNYAIKQDTLYLVWDNRKITITYHANGATGEVPPPISIDVPKYHQGYTLYSMPDTIILANGENLSYQDGYYFAGWNTKADGTGTFLPKGLKYVSPSSVDLYAVFETLNDHEYVDLGLPSGTLWAKTNIGTTCEAKKGDLFAYGETSPKTEYTLKNWKLRIDDNYFYLFADKSNRNAFMIDNKFNDKYEGQRYNINLLYIQDAASVNWGNLWRIPSTDEWKELFDNCTVEDYNYVLIEEGVTIPSIILRSKINGKHLFIPSNTDFATTNIERIGIDNLENDIYYNKLIIYYDEKNLNESTRSVWRSSGDGINAYWNGVAVRPVTKLK
ncbi:MAG: InlB B-repeat-containing protein [Bacteroidales bacterium]|nr:InlB B-repeat-containing protein [Bacteroidales bacterium]